MARGAAPQALRRLAHDASPGTLLAIMAWFRTLRFSARGPVLFTRPRGPPGCTAHCDVDDVAAAPMAAMAAMAMALFRALLSANVPVWSLPVVGLLLCWPLWHDAADKEHPSLSGRSLAAWGASTVEDCTSSPVCSPA
jgi:hypothetical protein